MQLSGKTDLTLVWMIAIFSVHRLFDLFWKHKASPDST